MFWQPSSGRVPTQVPSPDRPRDLVLYKYDSCPYCQRVIRSLPGLGLEIPMKDTLETPGVRDELVAKTGRGQVPCLFIDGQALFESADIVAWLTAYAKANNPG